MADWVLNERPHVWSFSINTATYFFSKRAILPTHRKANGGRSPAAESKRAKQVPKRRYASSMKKPALSKPKSVHVCGRNIRSSLLPVGNSISMSMFMSRGPTESIFRPASPVDLKHSKQWPSAVITGGV